jgi:hypothetical protein
MKGVCALCNKDLSETGPKDDERINHSKCKYCPIKEYSNWAGEIKMKYIFWLFFGLIMGLIIGFLIWGI